jgi:predicted porin
MNKIKLLLGTTALVGAGAMMSIPSGAQAAAVLPGGALDVTVSGFIYFRAHGGDLDSARLDPTVSSALDFSNDTEVHIIARGTHDATGMEYGGTVEFEADTNRLDNTDETWLFLRGGFGELRFGDEDGPVDNSAVGGFTVAAGTGGIDGSVIDVIGTGVVKPFNSDDSTKVRYYTPSFGGLQAGVSYTPNVGDNGASLAPKDVEIEQMVEGALVYTGSFGGFDFTASGVGSICDANIDGGGDDCHTWGAGVSFGLFGAELAGGYFSESIGDEEKDFFNAGIGASLGPVNMSVTYGQVVDSDNVVTNGVEIGDAYNLVVSADVGLMPGLVLAGDVGFFDNDAEDTPNGLDDSGYQAVARLGLNF